MSLMVCPVRQRITINVSNVPQFHVFSKQFFEQILTMEGSTPKGTHSGRLTSPGRPNRPRRRLIPAAGYFRRSGRPSHHGPAPYSFSRSSDRDHYVVGHRDGPGCLHAASEGLSTSGPERGVARLELLTDMRASDALAAQASDYFEPSGQTTAGHFRSRMRLTQMIPEGSE